MRNKGFSLMELLVVMAITILLLVIIMAVGNYTKRKARDAQRKTNVRGYYNGLNVYWDTKKYFAGVGDNY